jgi:hypothetical protein
MPAGDEFTGPVGYSAAWGWLALTALLVVVVWYAGVAWWARPRRRPAADRPAPLPDVRQRHLAELDRIEQDVREGRLSARAGHQRASLTVRTFVTEAGGVPARTMALADLRAAGQPRLADAVALMYPPEFAPAESEPQELRATLDRARDLVATWS